MEFLQLLSDENVVQHLTPLERRIYNYVRPENRLQVLNESKYIQTLGLIITKAVELGHPINELFQTSSKDDQHQNLIVKI